MSSFSVRSMSGSGTQRPAGGQQKQGREPPALSGLRRARNSNDDKNRPFAPATQQVPGLSPPQPRL
jgi:hypothetical protein